MKGASGRAKTPVTTPVDGVFVQYNEDGWHRLIVDGDASSWEIFEHPCIHKGWIYFTEYWSAHEGLYRLGMKVGTEPVNVCSVCGQPSGWNGDTYGPQVCQHLRDKWESFNELSMFKSIDPIPVPVRES